MTGPTHGPTGDPRTEAGRELMRSFESPDEQFTRVVVRLGVLAIEQEAAGDRDALAARVQVLLDVAAFALGALNDPEVLGEQAKRLLRAALRPDAPEDPASEPPAIDHIVMGASPYDRDQGSLCTIHGGRLRDCPVAPEDDDARR